MAEPQKEPAPERPSKEGPTAGEWHGGPPQPTLPAVLLALGIFACFVIVAIAANLTWFTLKTIPAGANSKPLWVIFVDGKGGQSVGETEPKDLAEKFTFEPLPTETSPEGDCIMWVAIGSAVWVVLGVALLLIPQFPPAPRRILGACVPGLLSATSMLLIIWQVAWIAKVVLFSRQLGEKLSEMTMTFATPAPTGIHHDVAPALGLYLGLGASVVAALLVSYLARWSSGEKLIRVFELLGLLSAGLVVGLKVQPWKLDLLTDSMMKWFKFVDEFHRKLGQ